MKKKKKEIHVKAYSLKDAFSDNTGHVPPYHGAAGSQTRAFPLDLEYKNAQFCYSTMPDVISKKISNDQELIQSDPTSCPQNQKGNN